MSEQLPKAYEPAAIEEKWAGYWVREHLWDIPAADERDPGKDPFTLLLPPPNVTGRLHMGHMLNQTEMDIIIRWQRMSGRTTLWVPGTDHAGIATQMMVERQLKTEGKKRQELGREKFVERVWEWKHEYGNAILDQMKRLGASVDWSREFFTMDERLSRAVREAFVRLYEQGLIYRGKYIVNWCPDCQTAISDLEVVHEETTGKLYEIKYPIVSAGAKASSSKDAADGAAKAARPYGAEAGASEGAHPYGGEAGAEYITIATTRPETMLADTAVAVNPKDERYKNLIGKVVRLPLIDREIPIVADDWANPEFGTGAVKITPAHDPNDFEVGKRHHLPAINILDEQARMNENAGAYAGLDRFKAREKVVAELEAQGLLVRVKDHPMAIGRCDRSKTIVEPRLSNQWFVKVEGEMARRAIEVVEHDQIRITPENYKTIYLNWMRNIHDWCISRQLWWGHRIPAWHCASCHEITVARETPPKCAHCGSAEITQETDVLDTWFSSALLPFTVFGWPEHTADLKAFYPTTLLITGFDILFFWVARMIMMGTWFMGPPPGEVKEGGKDLKDAVPFRNVYIHALVRDAERQKMSKTKGNVLDPIQVIAEYGTDATRFTLASMAAPGTDIAFNPDRTQGYRAFANKIWNASRFIFMNVERAREQGWWSVEEWLKVGDSTKTTLEDRWILSKWWRTTEKINRSLENYRFDEAATAIYDFFWKDFCDWYIELVKPRLASDDVQTQKLALFTAMGVLEGSLRLLAPFMPFITEEIFHAIYEGKPPKKSIALVGFPKFDAKEVDEAAEREMELLQNVITHIREMRAEAGVPTKEAVAVALKSVDGSQKALQANETAIKRLANVGEVKYDLGGKQTWQRSSPAYDVALLYEKQVDAAAERERLGKELKKLEGELANAERNLGNEQFLAKAPAHVVEGIQRRKGELEVLIAKAREALAAL
jgi:valyl-tRNA synthetase